MTLVREEALYRTRPQTRMSVRWRDLDPLGHVNHEVFLTYLEHTRDSWLDSVSDGKLGPADYVVARIEVDYKSEIALADKYILGECRLLDLGNTSFRTDETLILPDGEIAAQAKTVLVMWDGAKKTARPITDEERISLTEDQRREESGP